MGITNLPKPKNGKEWSGKQVFSAMLPKGLNLAFKTNTFKELQKINPEADPKEIHSEAFLKIEDG